MKDYYKVLGISRSADLSEIKQAYRKLIRACHPDVNPNPQAADWTRQLNEAYKTLSEPQLKGHYDIALKASESGQKLNQDFSRESNKTQSNPREPQRESPKQAVDLCCERCKRVDVSLRVSIIWRVYSPIFISRKEPIIGVFCKRCRVKESLLSNLITISIGWWNIYGLFWSIGALFKNAFGGEQPEENNAALLRSLGQQFFRAGQLQAALEVLVEAYKIKPDDKTQEAIKLLRLQTQPQPKQSFLRRFSEFDLHPVYYHFLGVTVVFLIAWCYIGIAVKNNEEKKQASSEAYTSSPAQRNLNRQSRSNVVTMAKPQFLEVEMPLPFQGAVDKSDQFNEYQGTTAPFTISTMATDGHHVVKLTDWNTGEFRGTYFINRGNTFKIDVPLGTYKVKVASGDKWYGPKHLFGPSTVYSYIQEPLTFRIAGDYAEGHRIELIPRVGGNLKTPRMPSDEW